MPNNYNSYLDMQPHSHSMRQANKYSADCIIAIQHPMDRTPTVAMKGHAITCITNITVVVTDIVLTAVV